MRVHLEERGWIEKTESNLKGLSSNSFEISNQSSDAKINPTFPGMMEYGLKKAVGADPKIRALEKRFKNAQPNLILNKKGTFDYDDLPDGQVINHFENVSFTTKDLLTRNLIKHFNNERIPFYPESILYDDLYDKGNVEEKYYQSLIASLTRLMLRQHHEEIVLGNIDWIKGSSLTCAVN